MLAQHILTIYGTSVLLMDRPGASWVVDSDDDLTIRG